MKTSNPKTTASPNPKPGMAATATATATAATRRGRLPTKALAPLESLHPHLAVRILVCLEENDRKRLAVSSRVFAVRRAQNIARIQKQKNIMLAAAKQRQKKQLQTTSKTGASPTSNRKEKKNEINNNNNESNKAKKVENSPMLEDPHTLLARLNTRRLVKRIRYYKKIMKQQTEAEADQRTPTDKLSSSSSSSSSLTLYPLHKTTEEIAMTEWNNLLLKYKEQHKSKQTNHSPDAPNYNHNHYTIPSPHELLLFSPCPRPVTVLASYPRSGNSLLRNLFERTTLRVTGSDMRGGLVEHDLVGEAAVSTNMVQFVKTHYPERQGHPAFYASRAVLLVRNPYDALESYFHLMMTNTHTASVDEEQRKRYNQVWEDMAIKEMQVWKAFHEFWLQQQDMDILLVRYEDLIRYPSQVMAKVIRFVLEISNMNFFQERMDRCIREEQIEQLGSYRPRSGGIGKSLSKYSPQLLQQINSIGIVQLMQELGYGEMLVPNKDEWELQPMAGFAVELKGRRNGGSSPLVINGGPIVRTKELRTDWAKVKRAIKGGDGDAKGNSKKCLCYRCTNAR